MDKRKIRDSLRLTGAILFSWLYIPHMVVYVISGKKRLIDSDIVRLKQTGEYCAAKLAGSYVFFA